MKIRPFTPGDLPAIVQIQKQVLPGGGWTWNDYLRLARQPGGLILLAETREQTSPAVAGFVVAAQTAAQAEILSLAVAAAYQRQGIGRELLGGMCRALRMLGVRKTYLEVRASNRAAIELYTSVGFALNYVRRNYYSQPPEDAYVMSLEMPLPGLQVGDEVKCG
jgi:ribosomal-protein-alanine N-acetyltransferase